MTQITIDGSLASQLSNLSGPVQFCDKGGAVLGWYQPGVLSAPPQSLKSLSPFSDEELLRRSEEAEGRP